MYIMHELTRPKSNNGLSPEQETYDEVFKLMTVMTIKTKVSRHELV